MQIIKMGKSCKHNAAVLQYFTEVEFKTTYMFVFNIFKNT